MDDAALIRMMQIGASLFKSDVREEDTVNFKDIFKNLQSNVLIWNKLPIP
jgi:hypothetical protein